MDAEARDPHSGLAPSSSKRLASFLAARWERYRAVATGRLFTLKGEPRPVGVHGVLRLRCPFNHEVLMSPRDLMRGEGCPDCNAAALTAFRMRQLEDAQELAAERGGKCLSTEYLNARSVLAWECQHGHTWNASLGNVRGRESWCPVCARRRPRPGARKPQKGDDRASPAEP